MATAYRYATETGGYMPVASQFVISYARKAEKFPLNRYVQVVEAPAPAFYYYKIDRDQAVRMRDPALHVWKDGADRPARNDNHWGHTTDKAYTTRYDWDTVLGMEALELATSQWYAKQVYLQGLTAQAMTGRTYNVVTLLTTSGNWPSSNTNNATTLGGAPWNAAHSSADSSSAGYMAIRKGIMAAVNEIFLQTNGNVMWEDLRLLMNPNTARIISNTSELRDYQKYGPMAKDSVEGQEANYNERFGLPPRLYGIEVVVEDSIIITNPPTAGATTGDTGRTYIFPDGVACLVSRPGKIDAQVGPSFSTTQVYYWKDQLTVEEFADPKHRKVEMHVVDNYAAVLPAPESGYLISGVLG